MEGGLGEVEGREIVVRMYCMGEVKKRKRRANVDGTVSQDPSHSTVCYRQLVASKRGSISLLQGLPSHSLSTHKSPGPNTCRL